MTAALKDVTQHRSIKSIAAELAPSCETPDKLVAAVLAELGDDLYFAVAEMLPGYVADYIRNRRNATINNRPSDRKPNGSAKGAAIRSWFARFLDESLSTADGWKRIGDCTRDDLSFVAESHRERATKETVRASQFERLGAALVVAGVDTVANLDADTVRAALDGHS